MSAEPYYSIGPHDVFQEQFGGFLVSDSRMRAIFLEYHRDLIDPEFWIGKQRLISAGREEHVFPYPEESRFRRRAKDLPA
jgi:isocitrate dehydrogenase kinase/phosphatase